MEVALTVRWSEVEAMRENEQWFTVRWPEVEDEEEQRLRENERGEEQS